MNNTKEHEILPMSKKERRCRTLPYHHFKTVKRKFIGLQKHQCRWQKRQGGVTDVSN